MFKQLPPTRTVPWPLGPRSTIKPRPNFPIFNPHLITPLLNQNLSCTPQTRIYSSRSRPFKLTPRPIRGLHGKVAIITGAGTQNIGLGNGCATSILLAEEGASVVCVDKHLDHAQQTADMINDLAAEAAALSRKPGDRGQATRHNPPAIGTALPVAGDVTNSADCHRIVDTTISTFGRLDILVNMVGILGPKGTAVDVDLDEWTRAMEINVTSMMLMARFAIPAMMERNEGPIRGSIVNMGSVAGLRGGTPDLLYPTSKGAVVNMTRAMAAQHGGDGIRVNCICPGMLYTPMVGGGGEMTEEMRETRRKRSLLGTEGNAFDCASAIRFLVSDESRWITGAILTVDAGASAAVSFTMK